MTTTQPQSGTTWTSASGSTYTVITAAEHVTDEIMQAAREIESGWYSNEPRIDWADFWDRLDGTHLNDGTRIDLGGDSNSPAMRRIRSTINRERRAG